jgi:hypothetical protein
MLYSVRLKSWMLSLNVLRQTYQAGLGSIVHRTIPIRRICHGQAIYGLSISALGFVIFKGDTRDKATLVLI